MADKEKKKKKKVKEEAPAAAAPAEEAPAAAPAPEPEAPPKRASSKGSKKSAKRSGSSVFSMFSQGQLAEFKEGFGLMDNDKDGIIGKEDLRYIFDQVGKLANEKELDEMLAEAPGPINFTQLLTLFATRMSGGSDEDDVIIAAFKTFDEDGVVDGSVLKHALMTWGDKFTKKEVEAAFDNMLIDDAGMIDTESIIQMLTGAGDDE